MPVLVARDRRSKALFTHLVPSKGVEHLYPEQALCRDIRFLAYPEVVVKSDQEPAIKAVAEAVKNAFAASNIRVQLEHSPKGDHHGKSNGEAEAAVEITQGLCRTYKDACETGMGKAIDPKSPLLAWMIEHAGNMYNLYAHDNTVKDGLTPFRRLKGRDWQVSLPPWGEAVTYRVRTKHKLEPRWATGIFCGVRLNTTERSLPQRMALWLLSPSGGNRRSFDGTQIFLQRSKGRHGCQSPAEPFGLRKQRSLLRQSKSCPKFRKNLLPMPSQQTRKKS